MDLGVTNRSGARFGPRAVRNVERIGPYEHVLRMAPLAEFAVADIGDVPLSSRYDLAVCHKDIETFVAGLVEGGIVPLSVGGDHSIDLPLLRAVGKTRPVGLIHIDAHCDTDGALEGCEFHHGGPFRQAVLDGVLDPERTIQIGIRGAAEYLWEFSYDSGMTVIHAEEAIAMGPSAVAKRARDRRNRPDLHHLRRRQSRSCFRARHGYAGSRGLELGRRVSDPPGLPGRRRDRR